MPKQHARTTGSFYLSEMAVSDRHGGGLTLQRVLGDDLLSFEGLVSVGRFARVLGPACALKGISRQIDLPLDALPDRTHALRCLKAWLRSRPAIHQWEAESAWRNLKKVIGRQRARLLVCPEQSLSVWLTAKAARELRAEYISWVMDDHPLREGGATMDYEPAYRAQWAAHLSNARKVFVISNAMREFYHEKFGINSEVLHGAVPLGSGCAAEAMTTADLERLRLGYAGALASWQRDPLELLADVAQSACVELHAAGYGDPDWLRKHNVVLRGQIPPAAVKDMLSQCDAVVLPVSFSSENTALSRLNVATKLSELCACGIPIFAIGPADAAMIRILDAKQAAVCVTTPSKEDLVAGLSRLRDRSVRVRVVANARRLFEEELNLEEMQRRWKSASTWLFGSDS